MYITKAINIKLNVRNLMLTVVIVAVSLASHKYYVRWKFLRNEATNYRNLAIIARTCAKLCIERVSVAPDSSSKAKTNSLTHEQINQQLKIAIAELNNAISCDEQAQKLELLLWFPWLKKQ